MKNNSFPYKMCGILGYAGVNLIIETAVKGNLNH